jgi:serine/threonine protein kinase
VTDLEANSTLIGDHRRYHVTGILGRGGFGTVYRARMEGAGGFQKDVAIKILRDENPPADVLARFRDEARILGLVRNPHVVGVDPPVRLGGRWAVVMEFVDGTSCEEVLHSTVFPPGVALEVCAVVAETLFELWSATDPDGAPLRILHRDLKPSNIQITPTGHVKLLDFGVARAEFASRETSTVAEIGGTPGYIAPERLEGRDGHEADVFSLGVVLHRLVTRQRPPPPVGTGDPMEPKARAALDGLLADPSVKVVVDFAATLRAPDWRDRPSGDRIAAECRALRAKVPGKGLREWSKGHVPSAPQQSPDAMVGRTLSETISRVQRPPPVGSWLVMGVSTALGGGILGVALVGLIAAVLVVWLLMRPPEQAPPPPEPVGAVEPGTPVPGPEPGPAPTSQPPVDPAQLAPDPGPGTRPEPRPRQPVPASPQAPPTPQPPTPEPQPAVPDPAPEPVGATVVVTGDADRVTLQCGGRSVRSGDTAPAGSCTVSAVFGGGPAVNAGTVMVPGGGTVTVACSSQFQRCRVK